MSPTNLVNGQSKHYSLEEIVGPRVSVLNHSSCSVSDKKKSSDSQRNRNEGVTLERKTASPGTNLEMTETPQSAAFINMVGGFEEKMRPNEATDETLKKGPHGNSRT